MNPRKLILVALDWARPKDPPLSLGHMSILANLRHHHINVLPSSWAVNHAAFSPFEVTDYIMQNASSNTDVALGAFVWNEKAIQIILNHLKKYRFPGRIILGGPQISYVKTHLESFYPQADIFIRGYAENALAKLMLADAKEPSSIKGVHYARQPDLSISATADLETLPSPFLARLIQPQPFIRWETQRGCPFRCAFCQHRESDVTMKRRHFPLSRVTEEVKWMTDHPVINDVAILDPTFNSGTSYLHIIDELIRRKFRGKLSLQCRTEMIKEDFLNKICQLNETATSVLELGLQTINREEQAIINRFNNTKLISKILTDLYKRRIKCEVSLIFGLPKQTVSTFQQSIEFCRQHNVSTIHAFPLMLLRGTPLHARKQELGLVESDEIASPDIDRIQVDIPHVVSSPSFTYHDWKRMAGIAGSLTAIKDFSQLPNSIRHP